MRRSILTVVAPFLIVAGCAEPPVSRGPEVPDWAKGAVWYQIFPDRFYNGEPGNDPLKDRVVNADVAQWQIHPWTSDWFKLQPWEQARNRPFYDIVRDRRYGGDLVGVIQKLDYLQDLGVEVIYFNPIFEAHSMHKYDATTYHHIDNNFGFDRDGDWLIIQSETEDPSTWSFTSADSVFLQLIEQAHERGIRIVLDGVFNHCGTEFWAFQDVLKNQQKSRFKDWFDITAWDDPSTPDQNEFDYNGWWGIKSLPEFREDEGGLVAPVREYFFQVTRRWMDPNGDGDVSDGIDGWRLDVARFVSNAFWRDWNAHVKSINPEAITVGEVWYGGTPAEQLRQMSEWIPDRRVDGVMNYPFAYTVMDFFVDAQTRISPSEFDLRLREVRDSYPAESNHLLMNLVDSHDTDRILSMIRNPDREYDRMCDLSQNPGYDIMAPDDRDKRKLRLIVLFQMTYPGAPAVYYGDEVGMWGADDPDDRKPMVWPDLQYENETYGSVLPGNRQSDAVSFDHDLHGYYKTMIGIRRNHAVLRKGSYRTILTDDDRDLFGFKRELDGQEAIVVLNNGEQAAEVSVPAAAGAQYRELLSDRLLKSERGSLNVTIPALGGLLMLEQ